MSQRKCKVIMLVIFKPYSLRLFMSEDNDVSILAMGFIESLVGNIWSEGLTTASLSALELVSFARSVGQGWLNKEMILATKEGLSLRWT